MNNEHELAERIAEMEQITEALLGLKLDIGTADRRYNALLWAADQAYNELNALYALRRQQQEADE